MFAGGTAALDLGGLRAAVREDLSLDTAGALDVAADSATIGVSERAALSAKSASVSVAEEISARAGVSASLATEVSATSLIFYYSTNAAQPTTT